jgi:hypothetical protein
MIPDPRLLSRISFKTFCTSKLLHRREGDRDCWYATQSYRNVSGSVPLSRAHPVGETRGLGCAAT